MNEQNKEIKKISTIEEKKNEIEKLLKEIRDEVNKVVICRLCKRKFGNQVHYLRHCNLSKIHLDNLKKIDNNEKDKI